MGTAQDKIGVLASAVAAGIACCLALTADTSSAKSADSAPKPLQRVKAGQGVGDLRLGDTRGRALELFPFKEHTDQEFSQEPGCGTEINWVDAQNPKIGNMFIRIRNDTVFQIDVATTRFHTAEGVKVGVSPEEVKKHYKGLHSYVLSNVTSQALGMRPLVYWIDQAKGIAFAFAYSLSERKRYLYEIIVFKPGSKICPTDDSVDSPDKRKLVPYSVEPGDARSD